MNEFQQHIRAEHPPGNKPIFEEWFFEKYFTDGIEEIKNGDECYAINRHYLPILWTSFYVNYNYGNDKAATAKLQEFIDSLYKSKKYFTVLQYDDGILNDISGLDIKVFGSGGGRIDFPIPLICQPHPYTFNSNRDVFASFSGSMTHPVRKEIMRLSPRVFNLFRKPLQIKDYCAQMARSVFALAPRGYGQSSFRICEALQYGSIPVYISDHWIVPGNIDFNEYGVLVHNDEVRNLEKILKSITPEQIRSKQEAGREIYKRMYSFEGCRQLILDNL